MLTLEIILGVLVKAALLLYIIKMNVLVNDIYMFIYNLYIYRYILSRPVLATLNPPNELSLKYLLGRAQIHIYIYLFGAMLTFENNIRYNS